MRKVAITFIVAGCFLLGFGIGIAVMLSINTLTAEVPNPQIEYIEVIDEVRVPYPVIVLDPQYIEYPVYHETIREVPTQLRNFENLSELREWRDNKVLTFTGSMSNDCGNIALAVQRKAYEDGYFVSLWSRTDIWHMGNLAICGKSVYGFDETGILTDGEIYLGMIK